LGIERGSARNKKNAQERKQKRGMVAGFGAHATPRGMRTTLPLPRRLMPEGIGRPRPEADSKNYIFAWPERMLSLNLGFVKSRAASRASW
jgi:hypothetical protein